MRNIRVHNYMGDLDSLQEVLIIGPYSSDDAAEADLNRFAAFQEGGIEVELTDIPVGDWTATPKQVVDVTNEDDLLDALFGSST